MKEPRFECLFCDEVQTVEQYREAPDKLIAAELAMTKLCVPHAQAIDAIQTARWKAELERQVA